MTSTFVSRGRRGTKLASTVVLRGRRGTHGTGWRAWSGFVACDAAALCVAGVALGDIHRRFAWQAWDRWHWVAPLGRDWAPVTPRHFAWQAWHNLTSTVVSRGSRGTKSHLPSFCVASVVLRGRRGTYGTGWRPWAGIGRL